MLDLIKHHIKCPWSAKSATLIDGKMILSFPQATKPIVWQMDIATVKISALEIQQGNDGAMLILKAPDSDDVTIATFTDPDHAVEQLIIVSNALTKAKGQITPAGSNNARPGSSFLKKTLTIIAAILALWIVVSLFIGAAQNSQNGGTTATIEDRPTDGQPLSADDFLQGR